MGAASPTLASTRRASEFPRHPSNVVFTNEAYATPPFPTGAPTCATTRCKPKLPLMNCSVEYGRSIDGTVDTLTTPPAAFPQSELAFERMTSTPSDADRSMLSNDVRPSGSVSGMPSSSTRMPREVPAFERSPAPRAPKPRIVMRTSDVP